MLKKHHFRKDFSDFCAAAITALLLLFMLYLLILSFVSTTGMSTGEGIGEIVSFTGDNITINIVILVGCIAFAYIICRSLEKAALGTMRVVLSAWILIFGAAFVCSSKLQPINDAYILSFFAQQAAKGDYSYYNEYLKFFPFQLGFVLYEETFFRLFNLLAPQAPEGFAAISLQLLNVVFVAVAFFAISGISVCLFKRDTVRKMTVILLFFCIHPIFFATFMYGNIPAFACSCLGIWMFLIYMKKEKLLYGIACAVFLMLAVLLKLNSLIVVLAMAIVWLICLIREPKFKSFLCLALMLAAVIIIKPLPQKYYEAQMGENLGGGIPQWSWMAMGLHEGQSCAGWYDPTYTTTAFESFDYDSEATSEYAKAAIEKRLEQFKEDPVTAAKFFSRKFLSQWNEATFQSLWINLSRRSYSSSGRLFDIICNKYSQAVESYMNFYQQLIYFGFVCGLLKLLWRKNILTTLLPLTILGGILYHLLFEAKSQYALSYFIMMIPIAAYGLVAVVELFFTKKTEEISQW